MLGLIEGHACSSAVALSRHNNFWRYVQIACGKYTKYLGTLGNSSHGSKVPSVLTRGAEEESRSRKGLTLTQVSRVTERE